MGHGWGFKADGKFVGQVTAPRKMQYTSQAVVLLADDRNTYDGMMAKAKAAENKTKGYEKPPEGPIPEEYLGENSRLVIIGHGDPASKALHRSEHSDPAEGLSPEVLGSMIETWLGGRKIKRLSLTICFGAGNRDGFKNNSTAVGVNGSFAWQLAQQDTIIKQVKEVSARRHKISGEVLKVDMKKVIWDEVKTPTVVGFRKTVGTGGSYHNPEDKVIITPGKPPKWNTATWRVHE